MVNRILCIPIETAKVQFWTKLRGVITAVGLTQQKVNAALQGGGMPDRLPLPPGLTLIDYARTIHGKPPALSENHQVIWKTATAVYPPFSHECDPELKKAAHYLAWYWYYSIAHVQRVWGISIVENLGRRKPSEMALVFMLSWLELSLVLQTENRDFGKVGLFQLGRWYHNNRKALTAAR